MARKDNFGGPRKTTPHGGFSLRPKRMPHRGGLDIIGRLSEYWDFV
jgi:hypothetical protein